MAQQVTHPSADPSVDSGASNHTVSVLSADGQLNQQANVIYTTYPGPQITQFQLG